MNEATRLVDLLLESATATIRICRDAATGKTREECAQEGLSYEEYPDIEVEVIGSEFNPGTPSRYRRGEFEADDPQYYDTLKAFVLDDVHRYDSTTDTFLPELLFRAGQPIELTAEEESEAQEALLAH